MKITLYESREAGKFCIFGRGATIVRVLDITDEEEEGVVLAVFPSIELAQKAVALLWPKAEVVQ